MSLLDNLQLTAAEVPPYLITPPTPAEVAASETLTRLYDQAKAILNEASVQPLAQQAQANRLAFAISIIAAAIHHRTPIFAPTEAAMRAWPNKEQNIPLRYSGPTNGYASTRSHVISVLKSKNIIDDVDQTNTCADGAEEYARSAIKLFKIIDEKILAEIGHDRASVADFFFEKCRPHAQRSHATRQAKIQKRLQAKSKTKTEKVS